MPELTGSMGGNRPEQNHPIRTFPSARRGSIASTPRSTISVNVINAARLTHRIRMVTSSTSLPRFATTLERWQRQGNDRPRGSRPERWITHRECRVPLCPSGHRKASWRMLTLSQLGTRRARGRIEPNRAPRSAGASQERPIHPNPSSWSGREPRGTGTEGKRRPAPHEEKLERADRRRLRATINGSKAQARSRGDGQRTCPTDLPAMPQIVQASLRSHVRILFAWFAKAWGADHYIVNTKRLTPVLSSVLRLPVNITLMGGRRKRNAIVMSMTSTQPTQPCSHVSSRRVPTSQSAKATRSNTWKRLTAGCITASRAIERRRRRPSLRRPLKPP